MRKTLYRAVASNDRGQTIEADGFRNGHEAQRWALGVLPDVSLLVLRVIPQGQSRGWYAREGGVGEWRDVDGWGKSV